jgi:hypothetical protein
MSSVAPVDLPVGKDRGSIEVAQEVGAADGT